MILQHRRSLASRVTLLTTMAVAIAIAFVAFGAFMTVRLQTQASLDASLMARAKAVAQTVREAEVRGTNYNVPGWLLGASDVRLYLVTDEHLVYSAERAGSPNFGTPEFEVATGQRDSAVRTITQDGHRYRAVTWPTEGDQGRAVVLVQSLDAQERVLKRLGLVMLLLGGAGVIGAGLAGWAVARSGLRPVRRLTRAAENIARTEDLRPIEVGGNDEIARLATAFNQMLTALAASRDRQRQLVADAGHELRTPLTSLRTNLDLLAQASSGDVDIPASARDELLEDVQAQIEELTTLIGDLVELGREESLTHVVEPVDLAEVVERALVRVKRRAPEVRFVVDADHWWMTGEAAALERAVLNLLDNAAKWSPAGGTVTVTLSGGQLRVVDEGPGISDEDLPHVFDRFWRSPESRGMPGSGLGLSIVHQIAVRHSGRVEAGRAPGGGAQLTLRIPGKVSPD
ncbi:HAMP domain-containing sensor histidine kinase [Nocardioides sp.]|uniref:HAMP domain-containing sensor histidine kinase n=1 Tax=Nocardioides sp. TaxID=35761 RepID=UPI002C4472F3|nr:HAMP domain-containing sensor histidine kinase [Nocardioides sp.]HSX66485.1 HAMP domain-containing sensor histidine kinase [Nocardioides sp.]